MWCLINNKNHSHLKNVHQGWNTQAEIDLGKYYRVWCVVVPSQYDNSKFYICTTKTNLIIAHRIFFRIKHYSGANTLYLVYLSS